MELGTSGKCHIRLSGVFKGPPKKSNAQVGNSTNTVISIGFSSLFTFMGTPVFYPRHQEKPYGDFCSMCPKLRSAVCSPLSGKRSWSLTPDTFHICPPHFHLECPHCHRWNFVMWTQSVQSKWPWSFINFHFSAYVCDTVCIQCRTKWETAFEHLWPIHALGYWVHVACWFNELDKM